MKQNKNENKEVKCSVADTQYSQKEDVRQHACNNITVKITNPNFKLQVKPFHIYIIILFYAVSFTLSILLYMQGVIEYLVACHC